MHKLTRFITIAIALALLVSNQVVAEPEDPPGLVTTASENDFETTVTLLEAAIESNKNIKLMLRLDHHKNAAKADLTLRPTTLFIFGNPKVGTPLMVEGPTLGIDLPQKILVVQHDSEVLLIYNDPAYLARRHHINGQKERLKKVSSLLQKLTASASKGSGS